MACHIDFRCLDEGFGGKTYKRKRSLQQQQGAEEEDTAAIDMDMDMDHEEDSSHAAARPIKRQAVASAEEPDKPVYGRPTYDGVIAGKVSGRKWKQVRTHRASALNVSKKRSTAEERTREREIKKAYKERIKELKEEIKQNKIEKRKKREEREKRKQENILKSGTKLQKVTNPKTLKKISKSAKQRKLLKVVPDDHIK